MKKTITKLYFALIVISCFAFMGTIEMNRSHYLPTASLEASSFLRSSGSPGSSTGSPGDEFVDCTDCHSNSPGNFGLNASITTNIPATGYVLGETYTINVMTSSSGASGWGFELTAEKAGGTKVGVYDVTGASGAPKIITSGGSVTHSNETFSSWSFSWTAPGVDEGDITFYAAALAANGSGTGGDQVVTTSEVVSPSTLSLEETNRLTFDFFPNPIRDYVTIKLPDALSTGRVEVFDFSGKLVKASEINSIDKKLNLEALATGMYILRVTSNGKTDFKKIIKE
ncbi:choice-of-anchor V domain-containing protein [Aestuariivivens sediminicola]|uniref:choice-of-anchor V domain-containing protein n=1 Tax=Aestuariivivens sediminicola TaxID=2913560 RepID=UPI001F57FE9D|nr:choice-of-anchor V domain-containing protein [Aestuariivivens sediminicola]